MSTPSSGPGIVRSLVTGAVAVGLLFVLCWVGALLASFRASHMFINLFTPEAPASVEALVTGLVWAVLFGAFSGFVIAAVYRATAFLGPRS